MAGSQFSRKSTTGSGTVAGVGTALAGGAAITAQHTNGTTSAGQTAFVLPSGIYAGEELTFINTSATAALLFPNTSSGTINGGSAGASVSCAQNKPVYVRSIGTDLWLAVIGA